MEPNRQARDDERAAKARRELDRITAEGQGFADSALAKAAKAAKGHFGAAGADQTDRVEVWAIRSARVGSLIAVVVLIVWLSEWFNRS